MELPELAQLTPLSIKIPTQILFGIQNSDVQISCVLYILEYPF